MNFLRYQLISLEIMWKIFHVPLTLDNWLRGKSFDLICGQHATDENAKKQTSPLKVGALES